MRKVTWTVVAIAGLSLLLCGAQEEAGAEAGAEASPAQLRQSVLQLQSEVAQLRQELAQLRAELDEVAAGTGVGGGGQEGEAAGEAVVNAIYTGQVRSASSQRLVLVDESGQPFPVELGEQTRILRNGQRISARQLQEGTRVRATVDLLSGRNQATEVVTLPGR